MKKISYNKSHQLITIYKGRFSMRLIGKKIFIYPGIILSLLSGGIALNSGLAFFNAQSVQADTTSQQLVDLLDPTGAANTHLLASNFYLKNYQSNQYLSDQSGSPAITDKPASGSQSLWTGNYMTSGHYQLTNENSQKLLTSGAGNAINFSDTSTDKSITNNQWELQSVPASNVAGKKNIYLIKNKDTGQYLAQDNDKTHVVSSTSHGKSAYWELDPQTMDKVSQVFTTDGFKSLTSDEQTGLFNYTSAASSRSAHMRGVLKGVATDEFFNESVSDQAAALRKVLDNGGSPQVNRGVNAESTGYETTYKLSKSTATTYSEYSKDGNVKGYRTAVTLNNSITEQPQQVINVYTTEASQAKEIAKAYAVIPYEFRQYITNVFQTNNDRNTFNTGKDMMAIRMNFLPKNGQIAMTGAHELGHSLTFNDPNSDDYSHTQEWTDAVKADAAAVSDYGSSNEDEGFAEFTQLVISSLGNSHDMQAIQTMYPHRWAAFEKYFNSLNGDNALEKLYSPVSTPFNETN